MMRTWWHRLSLRTLLAGAFITILILTLTFMGSGVWWLFRQSVTQAAGKARIDEVQALWQNRPGGEEDLPPSGFFSTGTGPMGWPRPAPPPFRGFGPDHVPRGGFGFEGGPGTALRERRGPEGLGFGPRAEPGGAVDPFFQPPADWGRRYHFHHPGPHFSRPSESTFGLPMLAHFLGTTNQGVRIWDKQGHELVSVGSIVTVPPPSARFFHDLSQRRLAYGYTYGQTQVLLIPLQDRAGQCFVELANPTLHDDPGLANLERFLLLAGCAAVLVGALAGIVLARLLSAPLERLSRVTGRVADGALTVRTNLPRGDNEVLRVADAFDRMVVRVQETFEAQRRFVADASHELRTPLTTISGLAEVVESSGSDLNPERRDRALLRIVNEVGRMERLLSDLLLLSSTEEAGHPPLERVSVERVLAEHIERMELMFPQHTVDCSCEAGLTLPWDESHLSRVLGNLLDNSAKYSTAGSTITVVAQRRDTKVEIQVRDVGKGIPPDDLPHVFERFYRADRSRNRRTGGSGLGLALVQALVTSYEGSIHIESQLDVGTTVTLLL